MRLDGIVVGCEDRDPAGQDFPAVPIGTIGHRILEGPYSAGKLDDGPLADLSEVRHVFPFPGSHVEPGGVNDRGVITVFIGILRDDREATYLSVTHPIDGGCSYDAAKFDSVEKFHLKQYLWIVRWPALAGALRIFGRDKCMGESFFRPRKMSVRAYYFMFLARIACFLPTLEQKNTRHKFFSYAAHFRLPIRIVKTCAIFLSILGLTAQNGHLHGQK